MTGEGMDDFFAALQAAAHDYNTSAFLLLFLYHAILLSPSCSGYKIELEATRKAGADQERDRQRENLRRFAQDAQLSLGTTCAPLLLPSLTPLPHLHQPR